jgi:5-methylcytosine-specific restriction protein B
MAAQWGEARTVDGILMQAIDAAASEPDRPFVLVIEEINRGKSPTTIQRLINKIPSSLLLEPSRHV